MAETTFTSQIVREAPEVEAQKAAVIQEAKDELAKDFQLPAYVAAGLSPTQLQAMDLAQQGIGLYEPYLDAASEAITQGQDLAMLGAQDIYGINMDPQFQAAREAYQQGIISADQLDQYQRDIAAGSQYIQRGANVVGRAAGMADDYLQADLGRAQNLMGQGAAAVRGAEPDFGTAERVTNRLGTYAQQAGQGEGSVTGGIAGINEAQRMLRGETGADLGASQAAIRQGLAATRGADTDFGAAERAAQGIGQFINAADEGMGTVAQGTRGMAQAARSADEYAQADLGRSQALINQAARTSQQADVDMGLANRAVQSGIQTAGNIAEAAMPAQRQAARTINLGIEGLLQGAEGYSPDAAEEFMNPYQRAVTRQAMQEMRRQADIARQEMASQAVRAGAFGGTREGVQRAEFERNVQDQMQQKIMQDYAQNYSQAQQAAMQGFEQQQQRQIAQGTALSQSGLSQSEIGQRSAAALAQEAALQGTLGTQAGALQSAESQAELAQAAQLAQAGQALGQQELQQAQLGQAATGLEANIYQNLVQAGYMPAQIAQIQGQMAAQRAGLLTDVQSRELQGELSRAQQLVQAGQALGQQEIQQTQLGQSAAQAMGALSAQEAQAGTMYGQIAGQQANITNQQAQNLANMQTQEAQLGLQQGQQLANIGQTMGAQEIQQTQLGQQGVQNMATAGQALGQMGLQQGQLGTAQGNLAVQQGQMYGQLGQGIGSLAAQQAGTTLSQGQALAQTGQQIASMGIQQGAIGQQAQAGAQSDVGQLFNLGVAEQQNAQMQEDAIRATAVQEAMQGRQDVAFLSDIVRGAPSTQMSMSTQAAPSASTLQQIAGIGTGLIAGAGAVKGLM